MTLVFKFRAHPCRKSGVLFAAGRAAELPPWQHVIHAGGLNTPVTALPQQPPGTTFHGMLVTACLSVRVVCCVLQVGPLSYPLASMSSMPGGLNTPVTPLPQQPPGTTSVWCAVCCRSGR
jgi:hypothetical protein